MACHIDTNTLIFNDTYHRPICLFIHGINFYLSRASRRERHGDIDAIFLWGSVQSRFHIYWLAKPPQEEIDIVEPDGTEHAPTGPSRISMPATQSCKVAGKRHRLRY